MYGFFLRHEFTSGLSSMSGSMRILKNRRAFALLLSPISGDETHVWAARERATRYIHMPLSASQIRRLRKSSDPVVELLSVSTKGAMVS